MRCRGRILLMNEWLYCGFVKSGVQKFVRAPRVLVFPGGATPAPPQNQGTATHPCTLGLAVFDSGGERGRGRASCMVRGMLVEGNVFLAPGKRQTGRQRRKIGRLI